MQWLNEAAGFPRFLGLQSPIFCKQLKKKKKVSFYLVAYYWCPNEIYICIKLVEYDFYD